MNVLHAFNDVIRGFFWGEKVLLQTTVASNDYKKIQSSRDNQNKLNRMNEKKIEQKSLTRISSKEKNEYNHGLIH